MRVSIVKKTVLKRLLVLAAASVSLLIVHGASAQDAKEEPKPAAEQAAPEKKQTESADKRVDKKSVTENAPKKMVQDATINLQTTVTGNQEQPRVLYILPWQSPQTENVDFESLDNEQKAAFGHVEREELRRELESAGEL